MIQLIPYYPKHNYRLLKQKSDKFIKKLKKHNENSILFLVNIVNTAENITLLE